MSTIENCTVLMLSTKACRVAYVDSLPRNGRFNGGDESVPFEARAFNEDYELRWVATPDGFDPEEHDSKGEAVLLTEKKLDLPTKKLDLPTNSWDETQTPFVEKNEVSYILWGKLCKTDSPAECLSMYDHRVGKFELPRAACGKEVSEEKPRPAILTLEYIATDDEHGNCAVIAERLIGWKSV